MFTFVDLSIESQVVSVLFRATLNTRDKKCKVGDKRYNCI